MMAGLTDAPRPFLTPDTSNRPINSISGLLNHLGICAEYVI